MNRPLAIVLLLAASCGDDDSGSDDLPADLVVDSDRIFLDGDDVDSDVSSDDVLDDFMDDAPFPVDAPFVSIFLSETVVDFGAVQVGMLVERSVEVFNNSPRDVVIGQIGVVGSGFALGATTCEMLLPSGASCALGVTATPEMAGKQGGELLVRTDVVTVSASLLAVGVR